MKNRLGSRLVIYNSGHVGSRLCMLQIKCNITFIMLKIVNNYFIINNVWWISNIFSETVK